MEIVFRDSTCLVSFFCMPGESCCGLCGKSRVSIFASDLTTKVFKPVQLWLRHSSWSGDPPCVAVMGCQNPRTNSLTWAGTLFWHPGQTPQKFGCWNLSCTPLRLTTAPQSCTDPGLSWSESDRWLGQGQLTMQNTEYGWNTMHSNLGHYLAQNSTWNKNNC